jgi:hypothetical protein
MDAYHKPQGNVDKDKAMAMAMDFLQTTNPVAGLLAHTVYHGSPHKFNKFDMSKIGTGEGAQAYGHGLYFAESPKVAQSYKQADLTYQNISGQLTNKQQFIADHLSQGRPEMNILDMYAQKYGGSFDDAMKDLISVKEVADKGTLYKVDIPDEAIPRMLDWDKPLSEQAETFNKILSRLEGTKIGNELGIYKGKVPMHQFTQSRQYGTKQGNATGADFYNKLFSDYGIQANNYLNEAGIPGIRYLDGSSRNVGEGTSNFVLFDDQLPRILEINGQPTGLLSYADEATKAQKHKMINLYRGEYTGNKGGKYWSPEIEDARQYTQSGLDNEILKSKIHSSVIKDVSDHVYAGDPDAIEKAMKEAQKEGYEGLLLDEGKGVPKSYYIFNRKSLGK